MRFIGEDVLEYLDTVRERIAFVNEHAEFRIVEHAGKQIEVALLPRTDPLPDEPSATVASYVRANDLGERVCAIVYPDRRGTGYGIARGEDHPRLDFGRVEGEPDVHFAHKSGFMCKTTATDPGRLEELVRNAWR